MTGPRACRECGAIKRYALFLTATAVSLAVAPPAPAQVPLAKGLAPYAQPLPLPALAKPVPGTTNTYNLRMAPLARKMHPALAPTTMWGYDDGGGAGPQSLGPAIVVQKGSPASVTFVNDLPASHMFGIDTSLTHGDTSVRTLQHLHGGFISGADDGNPFQTPMPEPKTQTVTYPNTQNATMLWYHDHALGLTRLNPYAGLAGPYIIRDANDTGAEPNPVGIPGGKYEVPLVLQDKQFTSTGQLFYPNPPWVPEFFGNEGVVNGAVEPYFAVEPRRYRLRLLNGANARFFNVAFQASGGTTLGFDLIGAELGMFDRPQRVMSQLLLPAERADLVIDFSKYAGKTITMSNAGLPKGVVSPAPRLATVMEFRVGKTVTKADPGPVPATLKGGVAASVPVPAGGAAQRNLTLEEVLDAAGNPVRLEIDGKMFHDPVSETPAAGAVDEWNFINVSADTHPMHLHLAKFQVVSRQKIDLVRYTAALAAARVAGQPTPAATGFTVGATMPPAANERGWKDTVAAHPAQVTKIRMKWDVAPGSVGQQKYVFHCHILEHEENDMMRPILVG